MTGPRTERRREVGLTLVELTIVMACLVPIIMAVIGTNSLVSKTLATNDKSAEVTEMLHSAMRRIGMVTRSTFRSTLQTPAVQADVDAGRAANVGDWIAMPDSDPRLRIRFQRASTTVAFDTNMLSTPRTIWFELDAGETANGADDDGDGLVDEGSIKVAYDDITFAVLDGVQGCTFMLDGEILRVSATCVRKLADSQQHHATMQSRFRLRNQ